MLFAWSALGLDLMVSGLEQSHHCYSVAVINCSMRNTCFSVVVEKTCGVTQRSNKKSLKRKRARSFRITSIFAHTGNVDPAPQHSDVCQKKLPRLDCLS
ncbi:hypothetical protein HBI56_125430 [Parastagonospora nodorum]|uniref:Secreted protein n=1 Tax=Phaeosphaeria nodorum (strain SN15 / ATCC MYA-4574 / FGSC 10173) TaxID=321614 RepID=A0A7U2F8S0_PHANO|nr:hypothetical protein HBH56_166760 [Parastagonospora nodorum]QRC98570.1 hypothetical protein JI435_412290 [Parastagonospora nodorum SN15]KAH3936262.1 hypothetical protein HBH54_029840 [Parastagonospora nodorum]KAH3948198.1 hypothetical protein HBH53_104660 [Parastagonospora nodorum]KAH3968866.1 hypothetical protein HBH51_128550 [Parastagonospora nodorum]